MVLYSMKSFMRSFATKIRHFYQSLVLKAYSLDSNQVFILDITVTAPKGKFWSPLFHLIFLRTQQFSAYLFQHYLDLFVHIKKIIQS